MNQTSENTSSRWLFAIPVLLVLLGAVLRLSLLGKALLWIDEITVMMFASPTRGAWEIIQEIYRAKFTGFTGQHMPFQYAWLNLFLQIRPWTGSLNDTWWVRLPFALLGIATLPCVYWATARIYGKPTGRWTLFLAAISFFHVYMSRDATSYAPMIFFLAMNGAGLAVLADGAASQNRRIAAGFVYLLGGFGALFSHPNAWFPLGVQGILLLAAQIIVCVKNREPGRTMRQFMTGRYTQIALLLFAATLPVLPLMWMGRTSFFASEAATGSTPEAVTLPLLVYQFAFFGWGRTGGREILFALAVAGGMAAALGCRTTRKAGWFHLGLLVLPALLFFSVLSRNFAPRYLAIVFLPLLVFAGHGIASLTTLSARCPWKPMQMTLSALVVGILVFCHAGPYRVLYRMTDKLHAMRPVYDWVLKNVPEQGLYLWRNSFYMRDVPQTYTVGNRYTGISDYPQYKLDPRVYEWRSQNVRTLFQRFPLTVLILEPPSEYEPVHWKWIHQDFRQDVLCSVYDDHRSLWAYGFWQNGYKKPPPFDFHIKYNTEQDVVDRARVSGMPAVVIPQFGGWGFVQTEEGVLLATPLSPAGLRIYNFAAAPVSVKLMIHGVAMGSGRLTVEAYGDADLPPPKTIAFSKTEQLDLNAGSMMLKPGANDFRVSVKQSGNPVLFVYSFDVAAVPGTNGVPVPVNR